MDVRSFLRLTSISMCGALLSLGWPSGGGWPVTGDTHLLNTSTRPMTPGELSRISDAFDYLAQHDPPAATTFWAGISGGHVGLVAINDAPHCALNDGAMDHNTLGINMDLGLTTAELAALLRHEWHHFVIRGTGGSVDMRACWHAGAYAEQLNALCFFSCLAEGAEQVTCDHFISIKSAYDTLAENCGDLGGQLELMPPQVCLPPNNQPTCGCR